MEAGEQKEETGEVIMIFTPTPTLPGTQFYNECREGWYSILHRLGSGARQVLRVQQR